MIEAFKLNSPGMRNLAISFCFFFLLMMTPALLNAQIVIEKSSDKEIIAGKEYYLHHVEAGQTLYSISKAYNIPIDEIEFENPDLKTGLKAGTDIKIPVVSRDVEVVKEIRENDFEYIYHIARANENLSKIAAIYDVSKIELQQANPELGDPPRQGAYVKIPIVTKTIKKPTQSDLLRHEVEPRETFFSLSRKYGLSIDKIKAANPGIDYLKVGDFINIPVVKELEEEVEPEKPKYTEHRVRPGETLYALAKYFKVPIDSIRAYNPGLVDNIAVGQVLRIPTRDPNPGYIEHRVAVKKTNIKKLSKLYDVEISQVKDLNPRYSNRLKYNQLVKIPVPPDPAEIKPEDDPDIVVVIPDEPEKKKPCYSAENLNKTYNIALMIPLYLEEVEAQIRNYDENDFDAARYNPFKFVQFYQGLMLALDSLKTEGLNAKVYVYDVDQHISKTIKVLQSDELSEMDLIIGPFYKTPFKYVANYADLYDIRLVNPLSKRSEIIEDNPLIFKVMPSYEAQLDALYDLIINKYRNYNILFVRPNPYTYGEEIRELMFRLEDERDKQYSISNELLLGRISDIAAQDTSLAEGAIYETLRIENMLVVTQSLEALPNGRTYFENMPEEIIYFNDSIAGIKKHASVIRPNLVIAFADGEVFPVEIMTSLNELKDSIDFTLIGLPEWDDYEKLDPKYLMNFSTHVFTPSLIDYDNESAEDFIYKFRQEFNAEPLQYAYDGFDIGLYFFKAMMTYGKEFEDCLEEFDPGLLNGRLRFMKSPYGGYENTYWNIYKYGYFQKIKLN